MKIDSRIKVYGDLSYRDGKRNEDAQSMTLINQCKKQYPHIILMHIKNEGKKTKQQIDFDKAMGMVKGASDFIAIGKPTLCIEMKNKDHTMSKWQAGQQEFLIAAQDQGAMACVCFGWEAGMEAIKDWIELTQL